MRGLVPIHRAIGDDDQLVERAAILRIDRRAHADPDVDERAGSRLEAQCRDLVANLGGPTLGLRRVARREYDHELVARVASAEIIGANRMEEDACDGLEGPIARLVAVGIVDVLESIDVGRLASAPALPWNLAHQGQRVAVGILERREPELVAIVGVDLPWRLVEGDALRHQGGVSRGDRPDPEIDD